MKSCKNGSMLDKEKGREAAKKRVCGDISSLEGQTRLDYDRSGIDYVFFTIFS